VARTDLDRSSWSGDVLIDLQITSFGISMRTDSEEDGLFSRGEVPDIQESGGDQPSRG
jgi:hypothetical protein